MPDLRCGKCGRPRETPPALLSGCEQCARIAAAEQCYFPLYADPSSSIALRFEDVADRVYHRYARQWDNAVMAQDYDRAAQIDARKSNWFIAWQVNGHRREWNEFPEATT